MALFNRLPAPAPRLVKAPADRPVLSLPDTLPLRGHNLLNSGPGRTPGSQVFLDLSDGRSHELFHARVQQVEPTFALAGVLDCPGVRVVRLGPGRLEERPFGPQVGQLLLVGPLRFDTSGLATSSHAWLLAGVPPAAMATRPNRHSYGAVSRIHASGAFGEIADVQGKRLFFHVSQLPPGVQVQVGRRVTYIETLNDKGWTALNVRPV